MKRFNFHCFESSQKEIISRELSRDSAIYKLILLCDNIEDLAGQMVKASQRIRTILLNIDDLEDDVIVRRKLITARTLGSYSEHLLKYTEKIDAIMKKL